MHASNENNNVENTTYTPDINPMQAKSFISPPPIPPLEILLAIINNNVHKKHPISELTK